MSYKIVSLRVKNFKCFDHSKYYEFKIDNNRNPVILSGPNGFGKTTFFDAIELLLSKRITRLDKQIENKNKNLGKNLLLNQKDEDGYIVLTLQNEEGLCKTIFAKILKEIVKIDVEKSILYGGVEQQICTEDLDVFLASYHEWNEDPKTDLKYKNNEFNIYYYVSQAESVHFLKKSISDRDNSVGVLLNTESVDRKQDVISRIIGSSPNASGSISNEIKVISEQEIPALVQKYKSLSQGVQIANGQSKNQDLQLYSENNALFFWDNPDIETNTIEDIQRAEKEVERLYYYICNKEDFKNKRKNKDIESVSTHEAISDYMLYKQFINAENMSVADISNEATAIERKVQVFNSAQLFLSERPDAKSYDGNNISTINVLVPKLRDYDFSLVSHLSREIREAEKSLTNNQLIISKLNEARFSLSEAYGRFKDISNSKKTCPYCNTVFSTEAELADGFEDVAKMLEDEDGKDSNRIEGLKKEFCEEIDKVRPVIENFLGDLNNENVNSYISKSMEYRRFVKDSGRVKKVELLNTLLRTSGYVEQGEVFESDIQRVLSSLLINISNPEFDDLVKQYNMASLLEEYGDYLDGKVNSISIEEISHKRDYLTQLICEKNNIELQELKNELRGLIIKKKKLENAKAKLGKLKHIYESNLKDYRKATVESLRIPLLIYTGKILQDYQNGLGVFIDEDGMRFLSNGEAKHDILNTFSSGQLAGFVLAFLFAMNKQYIKEKEDDIGFVLIDDPVQTMDDINIASLIEVMRNDFGDKQIILSTHEADKENYILYKFLKYGMIGQSLNVKETLYN